MLMKWLSGRGESVRAGLRPRQGYRPRLETLEDRLAPANIVWSGGGADGNFTNDANWVGGVAPGSNDTAIFDPSQSGGAANAKKSGTINAAVTVQALLLEGTYTGTVTALAPYSGATTVSSGTLLVDGPNGFAGPVTVAGSGTLGGTGTATPITANAGTVNPGDKGPGTLHSLSVDFASAATFFVDLTHVSAGSPLPGTDNDLLEVAGSAINLTLGGAALAGSVDPTVKVGDAFTIVRTGGGNVSGRFAEPFGPNVAFIAGSKFQVDYSNPTQVVLQHVLADATVTLSSSANPSSFGQAVLFTATVTPEAGAASVPTSDTVTFMFDGVTYPAVNVNAAGQAVFDPQTATGGPLSVGAHTLSAAFSGDANLFKPANGVLAPPQQVNPAPTTTTITSAVPNPSTYGDAVTFTAAVSPNVGNVEPTGTVLFQDGPIPLGAGTLSNVGGVATATFTTFGPQLTGGTHTITAVYSGDPNFNTSTSPGITQTVNRHPTVTTFVAATPNPSSAGAPVTFTFVVSPTVGALPSGTLTVRDGATILGTTTALLDLSGGATATFTTTRLGAGQHSITASYGGDQNYLGSASAPLIETVLTTKDFSFAVSSIDAQVYMHQLDLNGGPSIGWSLVAPGQFLSVAAGTYGPLRAPVVFGVGIDRQVYEAKLDVAGHLLAGWFRVAPGQFDSVVASRYGPSANPIVFGIGTASTRQQVFAARFNDQADLLSGWSPFAPGKFYEVQVGHFAGGNPELFGISTDLQVYAARFNSAGLFTDGWALVAPGQFRSLSVAKRNNGALELFASGTNGLAYASTFDTAGKLAFGWFSVSSNQGSLFVQVVAEPLPNGNVAVFGLGSDCPGWEALFDGATGQKLSGWNRLSNLMFTQLAAGTQLGRAKLYGIEHDGRIFAELFDSAGNIQSGFALTAPGLFFDVAVAEQF